MFLPDTMVMRYSGEIAPIEMISEGDDLMGPSDQPVKVVDTGFGFAESYRVTPVKGEPWCCTGDHPLHLVNSTSKKLFSVSITEFMRHPGTRFHSDAKLYRVGVNFVREDPKIDPYLAGLWIGDGAVAGPIIYKPDEEILSYCETIAPKYGAQAVRVTPEDGSCPSVRFRMGARGKAGAHTLWRLIKADLRTPSGRHKNLPLRYIAASRSFREQLLAGILDTDGSLGSNCFEVTSVERHLAEQYAYLARSLGLSAYVARKVGTIARIQFTGEYWRLNISGHTDRIPTRVKRKRATPRRQKKDVLRTGFTVTPLGSQQYIRLSTHSDRFLLGDFTVVGTERLS